MIVEEINEEESMDMWAYNNRRNHVETNNTATAVPMLRPLVWLARPVMPSSHRRIPLFVLEIGSINAISFFPMLSPDDKHSQGFEKQDAAPQHGAWEPEPTTDVC